MKKIYKLSSITITGIWGRYPEINCDLKLNKNFTIFVGKNGSGKTTVLRILESFFNANYSKLVNNTPDFSSIALEFKSSSNAKAVKVFGEFVENGFLYTYRNKNFLLDDSIDSIMSGRRRYIPRGGSFAERKKESMETKKQDYEDFKSFLNELIQFESITIQREGDIIDEIDLNSIPTYRRRSEQSTDNLDKTLRLSIQEINNLYHKNTLEINKATNNFFKDTFTKLLIPDELKLKRIQDDAKVIWNYDANKITKASLNKKIKLYNDGLDRLNIEMKESLCIIENFLGLHTCFTIPDKSEDPIKVHSQWCSSADYFGELGVIIKEFLKYKPATASSKSDTINKVDETVDGILNRLKDFMIFFDKNMEFFKTNFSEFYDKSHKLEYLYKPLFEFKHYTKMLSESLLAFKFSEKSKHEVYIKKISIEIKENKAKLKHLLSETEMKNSEINKLIETHSSQIEMLFTHHEISENNNTTALTRLFIHERISDILKEYQKLKNERTLIESGIEKLREIINDFIEPKFVSPNDGDFIIFNGDDQELDFKVLSSGEKQLLILLIKVFLAKNGFITLDEPELSLHIKWQQKLLESMHELNPNAQLIVATHSPEIASFNKAEVISFEK
jgi:predicted ATPase